MDPMGMIPEKKNLATQTLPSTLWSGQILAPIDTVTWPIDGFRYTEDPQI